jgi:hypothetical protein
MAAQTNRHDQSFSFDVQFRPAEGNPNALPIRRQPTDQSAMTYPALYFWWSVIFSENRCPLFGIML